MLQRKTCDRDQRTIRILNNFIPCWSWQAQLFVLFLTSFNFTLHTANCDSTDEFSKGTGNNKMGISSNPSISSSDIRGSSNLSKHPVLIVISFDGFRHDYFHRAETPALDQLRADGASVPFMRNQFVTKTFPNHMSIATGLHTESHGIVDNDVFDPYYNLSLGQSSDLYWNYNNETVPLWTKNELAGGGRKSGVMMWPGSDHPYGLNHSMQLPSRMVKWNETVPFEWRIDRVIDWITDVTEPVNLVFMYFEEPDEYAHAFGPESDEVTEKIEKLDNATGYLVKQLKSRNIFDSVNLIFLSDHGFQEVRAQDMVNISSIVDPNLYDLYGSTPVIQIQPKPGNFDLVYDKLKNVSTSLNFTVYSKKEIEQVSTWYFSHNRRIMDIIVVADLGFVFEDFAGKIKYYDSHFKRTPSPNNKYGVHGYDNRLLPMHPFFISHGPSFKHKYMGDPFDNIDLFPLICKILGIETPTNNGTYEHVKNLIVTQGFAVGSPVGWAIGAGLVFGVMILLGIMSILASTSRERDRRARSLYSQNGSEGYRFINRRNSYDSTDENENLEGNLGVELQSDRNTEYELHEDCPPGKEEYQALLMSSSTEEV